MAVETDDRLAGDARRHVGAAAGCAACLAKGLRYGFGVAVVSARIPLNLVQEWLGHAQLTTSAIYANANAVADKEKKKDIARRMWGETVPFLFKINLNSLRGVLPHWFVSL